MKRKILTIFILITMAISFFPVTSEAKIVKNNKLVLIERWDGNWYAYESMIDDKAKGYMIDLKSFATFMDYDYWYNYSDDTVTIAKSKNRFNTYKINQKKYVYQSSKSKKVNKEAKYKTYYNEDNNRYYVHATTLGNLCNYKYFEGKDKTGKYGKKGFTNIVCFSNKGKITKLPDIKKVKNDVGYTWNDTFVSFDHVKEPVETKIFGLDFKATKSFTNGNLFYWEDDTEFLDIQSRFKEIVSYNSLANMNFEENKMSSTFNSDMYSFDHDLVVDGWENTFSIKIKYSLNDTKKQLLKAICYKISSTPETLYNVIVYDYTKEAFIPDYDYRYYGDFKISAYNIMDSVVYYVKPAK